MRYLRPALLAVALVVAALSLSTAAVATPAGGSVGAPAVAPSDALVVRNVPNTTNYLDIRQGSVQRGEYGTASLDVGAAVAMDTVRARTTYETYTFTTAYGRATDSQTRKEQLRAAVTQLATRLDTLENRQATAIERYNAGEITTRRLLRELATVHVAAEGIATEFERLRTNAGVAFSERLDDRVDALEADLVALRGPVRARAGAAMAGERPATTAYALTSSNGVVLSTTGEARIHREAYLPGNRAPSRSDQFTTREDPSGITAASARANGFYPWAYGDAGPSIQRVGRTSVYVVTLDHSQGVLETYLDGATRSVFRETQTLRLDRVPTTTVTTNETADLRVRVNRTYGTGPMEVAVTDPTTGQPVDAVVRVNGFRLGPTGPDGRLWTTTPHRFVTLRVDSDDHTVRAEFFAN